MSQDELNRFSTEMQNILSLTEKGMQEWASEGGSRDLPAIAAVIEAVKQVAEANGELWKEIHNRKGAAMHEELMGCVSRLKVAVGQTVCTQGQPQIEDKSGAVDDIAEGTDRR